jgi:hypothetical protein
VTESQAIVGPTSFQELARLSGEFDDWHNVLFKASWVTGPLDIDALREAWHRVGMRHDAMRRSYLSPDWALTHPQPIGSVDVRSASTDAEAIQTMSRLLGARFDLFGTGLSRLLVVTTTPDRHLLGIAIDHILSDGVSWERLKREFVDEYSRTLSGVPPLGQARHTYQEFATRQRADFRGDWGARCREFWRNTVARNGMYPPAPLASLGDDAEPASETVQMALDDDVRSRIYRLARDLHATAFSVIAASLLRALGDISGKAEVGLTTNQHGRFRAGTSDTLGLFVQTVPLYLQRRDEQREIVVADVMSQVLDMYEYSVPLRWLSDDWEEPLVAFDRDPSIYLNVAEGDAGREDLQALHGTQVEGAELDLQGGKSWVKTVAVEWSTQPSAGSVVASFNSRAFPRSVVEQLIEATVEDLMAAP